MFILLANFASIVGLVVSVWVLVVAKGAKAAADSAREAAHRGNAAEEFRNLGTLANEFLSHVEAGQTATAAMRARDLMSATTLATRRWKRFLSVSSLNRLEEAHAQVSIISRALSKNTGPLTAREKDRILTFCHEVVKTLNTEAGALFSHIEEHQEV